MWLLSNLWTQLFWPPLVIFFATPSFECCLEIASWCLRWTEVLPKDKRNTSESRSRLLPWVRQEICSRWQNYTQEQCTHRRILKSAEFGFPCAELFLWSCEMIDAYQGICCSQTCRVSGHTSPSGCHCSHTYTTGRPPHWSYWHSWVSWACLSQTPRNWNQDLLHQMKEASRVLLC